MEKKLNIQRLLESGFIDRFNEFIKRYEEAFRKNKITEIAEDWIKKGDYDYIGHFLRSAYFERSLPFSAEAFIKMDFLTIKDMQYITSQRIDIAKEKEELYREFLNFYE